MQDTYRRGDTNTSCLHLPSTNVFAYDGNGNMTTNGTRVFAYDDENQLTSITEPGAWKSEFTYDGRMRRRLRKEYTWRNSAWVQTNEVRYVYDGKLPIQERYHHPQLSGSIPQQSVTYTRGRDLSGSLEGAGGIGGLLARTDSALLALGDTTAHGYYHADGNGNITALIASNQVLAAKYLFDPFGRILAPWDHWPRPTSIAFRARNSTPIRGVSITFTGFTSRAVNAGSIETQFKNEVMPIYTDTSKTIR